MTMCKPGSKESSCTYRYATAKVQRELQSFLGILMYLIKFLPVTPEVCKSLLKLTLVKADWMWNGRYQDLYDRAKRIVEKMYA